ncbi:hypothetical protein BLM14_20595 (plasmid) [Phyllobacterium zundukense]|uniref:LysR substrate-binding domain-containing protein n=1 Tax=Phyllobacterium zundukense TaxID=1867719 RepID=UPI000C4954EC|nr:LysR substrate-binding domain-containing protein [Phyllobacterium zundukense]ATU94176.1 hypothetical protein BLM14_20595 [Phyllobacterium zundukense]
MNAARPVRREHCRALASCAPAALDQVRATVVSHRNFDPAEAKLTVSIACTDYLQAVVVKPLVVELRMRAPGVRVALRNLDVPQLDAQMARGDVDLALMTPQAASPSLRTRHLFNERYVLIGRRKHPRLREGITVEEFAEMGPGNCFLGRRWFCDASGQRFG